MGRGPIIKELSREFEVEVLTNPSNERILVTACPGRGDTGPFPGSHPGAASSTKSQSLPAVEVGRTPRQREQHACKGKGTVLQRGERRAWRGGGAVAGKPGRAESGGSWGATWNRWAVTSRRVM